MCRNPHTSVHGVSAHVFNSKHLITISSYPYIFPAYLYRAVSHHTRTVEPSPLTLVKALGSGNWRHFRDVPSRYNVSS